MKNAYHLYANCQTRAKQVKEPFEVRADWGMGYPKRHEPNSWVGVIRLAEPDSLHWLRISRFQDKSTDTGATDPFAGTLILGDSRTKYRVSLLRQEQASACYLRLHFEAQN